MKNFDNPTLRSAMNKILLAFIFYVVAAASFNGFLVKWGLNTAGFMPFEIMYDGTAIKPFIHRQLMISAAKKFKNILSEKQQTKLTKSLEKRNFAGTHYSIAQIPSDKIIEYYFIYELCLLFLFASMFFIREIVLDLTGNELSATITACVFALLFTVLDVRYWYDYGEIFFFSLATLCACKGWWIALIFLSPIAEYNKESFLFFVITLFPLLMFKIGKKKAALTVIVSALFSGIVYLKVRSIFAQNPGLPVEFHLDLHIASIFDYWFSIDFIYGSFFGVNMFLPHVLLVAWIFYCSWKNLPQQWKQHFYSALAINVPLYLFCCGVGEIRNLSMLYMGFIAMLSIYIKNLITVEGRNFYDNQ